VTVPTPAYLDYEEMRDKADAFLAEHGREGCCPVDIEAIVDVALGIDIAPVSGLKSDHDIDGLIACDGSTIWVDGGIYWSDNPFRYRFTLAHELGHWLLHRDLLESACFETLDDWQVFLDAFPDKARSRYEFQAYCMGGLLLVQREPLAEQVAATMALAEKAGNALDLADEAECRLLCRRVGRVFEVSEGVVIRRGRYDGHWDF
jgi:hypothetical protein